MIRAVDEFSDADEVPTICRAVRSLAVGVTPVLSNGSSVA
jgi:hypothetical protein